MIQFDHVGRVRVSEGLSPERVWCGKLWRVISLGPARVCPGTKHQGAVKLFCGSFDSGNSGYLCPKSVLALKWEILGLL